MSSYIKIGILGAGIVGVSLLELFNKKKGRELLARVLKLPDKTKFTFSVWDKNAKKVEKLSERSLDLQLSDYSLLTDSDGFVDYNDYIIVSPGIDISVWQHQSSKFINELDLFADGFLGQTIALTGTLGKTTVTHLLESFLNKVANLSDNFKRTSIACGNIGKPMLSLISQAYTTRKKQAGVALLELSSFQLEFNRAFSPDIAIITNCYENHLDRHKTFDRYVEAKFNLIAHHTKQNTLIISSGFFSEPLWSSVKQYIASYPGTLYIVSQGLLNKTVLTKTKLLNAYFIFIDQGFVWCQRLQGEPLQEKEKLIALNTLSTCTFVENWLFIIAVARSLELPVDITQAALASFTGYQIAQTFPHRLEYVASINNVDYYNDSKSTVIQSTQAAVESLQSKNKPIMLIVGGLSKGVDRKPFAQWLSTVLAIKKVYCFGKQCADFSQFLCFSSLEQVLDDILTQVEPGDIVLFSPAGASFDCFKNYMHRGVVFKQLVENLSRRNKGVLPNGAKNTKAQA